MTVRQLIQLLEKLPAPVQNFPVSFYEESYIIEVEGCVVHGFNTGDNESVELTGSTQIRFAPD